MSGRNSHEILYDENGNEIMFLDGIEEGMVIKNYLELCIKLKVSIRTGNSKMSQIRWFEKYFEFTRDGHKYVIGKVNRERPMEPQEGMGRPREKIEYNSYKVPTSIEDMVGVYKIINYETMEVYIGSTNASFRRRFIGHTLEPCNVVSAQLSTEESVYKILEAFDEINQEELLLLERDYILEHMSDDKYTVLNEKLPVSLNPREEKSFTRIEYRVEFDEDVIVKSTIYKNTILLEENIDIFSEHGGEVLEVLGFVSPKKWQQNEEIYELMLRTRRSSKEEE